MLLAKFSVNNYLFSQKIESLFKALHVFKTRQKNKSFKEHPSVKQIINGWRLVDLVKSQTVIQFENIPLRCNKFTCLCVFTLTCRHRLFRRLFSELYNSTDNKRSGNQSYIKFDSQVYSYSLCSQAAISQVSLSFVSHTFSFVFHTCLSHVTHLLSL